MGGSASTFKMYSTGEFEEHGEDRSAPKALQAQHLSDEMHQRKKRKLKITESGASTSDRLAEAIPVEILPGQGEGGHITAMQKSSTTISDHPTLQKSHSSANRSILHYSKTLATSQNVKHEQRQGAQTQSLGNRSQQPRNSIDLSSDNPFNRSSTSAHKTHEPHGRFNFIKRTSGKVTGSASGLTGQPYDVDDSPTKGMSGYFGQSRSSNEGGRVECKCSQKEAYDLSQTTRTRDQTIQAYEKELHRMHQKEQAKDADLRQILRGAEVHEKEQKRLQLENQRLGRALQASEKKVAKLKPKIHDLGVELAKTRDAYATSLREEQERSFKKIGPGGWLPEEESKVKGHLDRLKRMMKSWVKDYAVQEMLNPDFFKKPEHIDLWRALSKVVLTTDGKFPQSIYENPKIPSLLLNALLAYDIYTNVIGNPFFLYSEGHAVGSPSKENLVLNTMYEKMKATNEHEAHFWRAQTLRLLQPPKLSTNEAEQAQRESTLQLVVQTSHLHAKRFLNGQAMHLVGRSLDRNACEQQVTAIFQQAGEMAYGLWTRRNNMECFADISECYEGFNNNFMDLHTLVQWDDDSAKLNGTKVSVLVHPLLVASGNDDGEGYDEERVWAPAVALVDI